MLKITGFTGANRALHPKLLADTVGTVSLNQKPGRGDLRPWKAPSTVATVPSGRETIYRMGRDTASDANYWLSWTTVVHAVRGFDIDDTTERTYYTGDGAPKVTDNTIALASAPYPTANRPLGLPAPTGALLSTTDAGTWTGEATTYAYVYTYINDWGWESAPSPVSLLTTRPSDATATLGSFASLPSGSYNITGRRIYRTQTGSGGTEFFFLREILHTDSSTTDDGRTLGEVLPTTTWLEPPADLSFLTPLWNGMLAGLSGTGVRFCEAYIPYAWPVEYDVVPPDAKAVALGVFGQSLLVLTTGRPLLVQGSSPDSMEQMPPEFPQGCIAPLSVVSMGNGVAWASEDGLCWYGAGGANVLTAGLMTREDWQALVPSSITGYRYEGLYFGSYNDGSGRKGFVINPTEPKGLYFLDTGYATAYFDQLRDQLYVLNSTNVQKWDAGSAMSAIFRSKAFQLPSPANMSCARVVADAYPCTLRVYADSTLKHTQVVTNEDAFWLPSGYLASTWEVEVECTSGVQAVLLASSIREIRGE